MERVLGGQALAVRATGFVTRQGQDPEGAWLPKAIEPGPEGGRPLGMPRYTWTFVSDSQLGGPAWHHTIA